MFTISRYGYRIAVVSILLLVVGSAIACKETSVVQLPAHKPVGAVYSELEELKAGNPTLLDEYVKAGKVYAFHGTIWKIDGKSIQFAIEEVPAARDAFVECEFREKGEVLLLRNGSSVAVYGRLDEAFAGGLFGITGDGKSVKFKNCYLYPSG